MDRAAQLLDEVGSPFKEIENVVWEERVHFAAAIARIRIKNKAFTYVIRGFKLFTLILKI